MCKIKVNLFKNYQGDNQISMLIYGDKLEQYLKLGFSKDCSIEVYSPQYSKLAKTFNGFLLAKKMFSYWKRFVEYPYIASKVKNGVNHIVDHNSSYLINYLDPEKTVVTCHDLIFFRLNSRQQECTKFIRAREKVRKYTTSGLLKARKIIADSENTKKDIIELTGRNPDDISVIYPGVNSCFYKITDEKLLEFQKIKLGVNFPFVILHVGENSSYKNIEGILYSLEIILSRKLYNNIHFVKVGKDFTSKQYNLIQKLKLINNVHYLGILNNETLALIYNLSNVLVFPSWYEGFGWPPLEAMACGIPVVCSNEGSLKEIVDDAACIIKPEDYERIANAVCRLINDFDFRNKIIKRGFENAKRFDWCETVKKVFNIYLEILKD